MPVVADRSSRALARKIGKRVRVETDRIMRGSRWMEAAWALSRRRSFANEEQM